MTYGRELTKEFAALDERQKAVVTHRGNVVALAGPGAGKTRTIVARAAHLLSEEVGARQSVAAITYTKKAAKEVGKRLTLLGLRVGRGRLVSRTIHSFCLNEIIRPLGGLTGVEVLALTELIDGDSRERLLEACIDDAGLLDNEVKYLQSKIALVRRTLASGNDASRFGDAWVSAMAAYEEALARRNMVDFDSIILHALTILRDHPAAARLFAKKTPHVIVDEYQDLGPVLHSIVLCLLRLGVRVTAVGDPDQIMYAYEGANSKYIRELAAREDFEAVPLETNYRSTPVIVRAGEAVLGEARGYVAHRTGGGLDSIRHVSVHESLQEHANATRDAIVAHFDKGLAAEDIAILYPSRGPLQETLEVTMSGAGIPVLWERGRDLPSGRFADFVSGAASRALTGPLPAGERLAVVGEVPVLRDLATQAVRLAVGEDVRPSDLGRRSIGRRLVGVLDRVMWSPHDSGREFVEALVEMFATEQLGDLIRDETESVLQSLRSSDLTVAEIAGGRIPGTVVATTYHSSKGREFKAVILPGLCEGLVPRYTFDRSQKKWSVTDQVVAEWRRNFYVAVTRAEDSLTLISSAGWLANGRARRHGPTRFVAELLGGLT